MKYEEKTLSRKEIYRGNVINVDMLEVELPDGKKSKRDIVYHPGASAIVPLDSNRKLYMVRQYRKSLEKTSLEIPAGKLDKGENPEECAVRELQEETGLAAGEIKHIFSAHSSPGFCNEVLHFFIATNLREGISSADEDEFISCEKHSVKDLVNMVFKGEITDAKSIIGIMLAERYLDNQL